MPHYQLVNPHIEGSMPTMYKGKDPSRAASKFWNEFTKHIRGHVPHFNFTLKGGDNSLSHYHVQENEDGTYKINNLDLNIESNVFDEFKKQIEQQQEGGRRRSSSSSDSSSDSSSSSSSYVHKSKKYVKTAYAYNPLSMPVYGFHYINGVYRGITANPRLVPVSIPTFLSPVQYGFTRVYIYP